jgi:hypothetical protein
LLLAAAAGLYLDARQPATDIRNHEIGRDSLGDGRVTAGTDTAPGNAIATTTELAYESPELETGLPKANAIGVNWTQEGDGEAELEVRTNDGDGWSEWSELDGDDRKDGTVEHSAILLTENAERTQYRFALSGNVKLSKPKVFAIDATTGPDPEKKTVIGQMFGGKASAISNPRIYSRSEWGSPEAGGSPRWTPNYHKLQRVMVHHTVSNATNSFSSSAANVRAIWYQHANNNNWGDIGYNYLVDMGGRIFQGRYYNKAHAEANDVEVEGGHTFGYNDRSIGIAALGDFRYDGSSGALRENIGKIAGFKMAPYKLGATARYQDESGRSQYRIGGHRNYTSTTCPGNNLYNVLGTIRNRAQVYRDAYVAQSTWDYGYVSKSSHNVSFRPGQTSDIHIVLRNDGENVWRNEGSPIVRLGTDRPRDRNSKFAATWLAPSRTGTFEDQAGGGDDADIHTVQPGETARFEFTVTAPSTPGTYKEYFRPVADGAGWFYRDIGMHWSLKVLPPGYNYGFVSKSATPATITPGVDTQDVTVRLENTGTESWPVDGALRLGTDRGRDHKSAFVTTAGPDPWISRTRPSAVDSVVGAPGDTAVDPGQVAEFDFTITVPAGLAAGNYKLYVRPVLDGVKWLPEDYGINFPVPVAPQRRTGTWTTRYDGSQTNFQQGTVKRVRLAIANTGRMTWQGSGPDQVRLATSNPKDRSSAFRTEVGEAPDAWLSPNRASAIDGTVTDVDTMTVDTGDTTIEPGQVAFFDIYLKADRPVGTYREYFALVQEGIAWFPDTGYNMYLRVVE